MIGCPAVTSLGGRFLTARGEQLGITWYDILGVLPGATAEQIQDHHQAKAGLLRPELIAGAPSPVVAAATRAGPSRTRAELLRNTCL